MAHPYYEYTPIIERTSFNWPNNRPLAVVPIVVLGSVDHSEDGGHITPAMWGGFGRRPYPDFAGLSYREYGHQIGFFRIIDAIEAAGLTVSVAMDVLTANRYPYLVEYCLERHYEIIGHGVSAGEILSSNLPVAEEAAYIRKTLDGLENHFHRRPSGWLSPAQSESLQTPRILADEGVLYVCDWCNDEQPYDLTVPSGRLIALPLFLEYDDSYSLIQRGLPPDVYGEMLKRGAARLAEDGESSARVMAFQIHPWVSGQPSRIQAMATALSSIGRNALVWPAAAGEVVSYFVNR